LVDYDVILKVHPSSKVSKLNTCSIVESVHYRLMKVVLNDSPTQVLSTCNTSFCINSITNRVINKKRFLRYWRHHSEFTQKITHAL